MARRARFQVVTIAFLFGAATVGNAQTPTDTPLFSRHVVPLLSRLGCNAGLCHGAVQGKGGLRLSLFGVEPALDHERLLREAGGRRLNVQEPDASLLLLKATGRVPHEGGKRLEPGGPEHQVIRRWISAGARLDRPEQGRITRLTVTPANQALHAGGSYPLRVEARFADGSAEDVTPFCTFESRDRAVAEVERTGQVHVRGVGDTAIVVRFRAQPALATVLVPGETTAGLPQVAEHNFIDRHVFDKLRRLQLPPADLCDDATFLRRASLDVTGALPTPDEIRAFLADKGPDKRTKKIDELLARPGYSALWATRFCDLLKPRISYQDFTHQPAPASTRRFYEWLRTRLRENTPYDEMVERMLTATSLDGRTRKEWIREVVAMCDEDMGSAPSGDLGVYGRRRTLDLYYHRFDSTGVKGTIQVAHAFLGLRLQCAQCHRHPTDVWTQDDLLSFANFFNRVRGNTGVVSVKEAGEVKKRAGGSLSADEKKHLQDEAKQLAERAKQLQEEAKKARDKAEADRLQREAKAVSDKAGAMNRAVAILDCSQVFHAAGNPFGWASVSSPLGTQKSEQFRFLGETTPVTVADDQDPRALVVPWMRRPDNPFFARAIVNRIWAHYFARGLIEPVDDLSPLNAPSHPELLQALCDDFVQHGYDLKRLHRIILASRAYQLSSRPHPGSKGDTRNFAAFYRRRLAAEVLVDAVDHATGSSEKFSAQYVPAGARALEVPGSVFDGGIGNPFVEYSFAVFGRPSRNPESLCDCDRETRPSLLQSLYLANHPEVRRKIVDPKGRLAQILKEQAADDRRIDEIYLWTLSRLPSAAERRICLAHVKQTPSSAKGLEGLMWSLLNTSEFVVNH
jgi:hypothetical protein